MIFHDKIKKSYLENRILFVSVFLICLAYAGARLMDDGKKTSPKSAPVAADTIIPAGMVLVPIELANIDSVRGLINGFGLIDLYVADHDRGQRRRIGHKIKILQAPLNPNEFAVLVDEEMSVTIMKSQGVYTGVVQNRTIDEKTARSNPARKVRLTETNVEYSEEDHL